MSTSSRWTTVPACPPPADGQLCQPVLRRSFCHASVPVHKVQGRENQLGQNRNLKDVWGFTMSNVKKCLPHNRPIQTDKHERLQYLIRPSHGLEVTPLTSKLWQGYTANSIIDWGLKFRALRIWSFLKLVMEGFLQALSPPSISEQCQPTTQSKYESDFISVQLNS